MAAGFAVFVGLRYAMARRANVLLSFVTLLAMLGISLGVTVLIVALSVMNGSIGVLRSEALKAVPHVTISATAGELDWQALAAEAGQNPEIVAAAPFVEGEGLLRFQGRDAFVRLRGIEPQLEAAVHDSPSPAIRDSFAAMERIPSAAVFSSRLAAGLGAYPGEEVSILALASLLERSLDGSQALTIAGYQDFGIYGEANIVLLELDQALALLAQDPGARISLRLKVADVLRAREIAETSFAALPGLAIVTWQERQASLFKALAMEKLVTTILLLMIVVVGAVNIVSTLVMAVTDKRADIAILRTMGASSASISAIFIVQGMIAGIAGTLTGTALGVLLGHNIAAISETLERWLNMLPWQEPVYLLAHLQTWIEAREVLLIALAALSISLVATLYPAWRSSKVQPAEVLRHE